MKGEESRRVIVQAAITCIASQGLSNTTLDRVAEGAGVSRALVVFHFKSKNGLLSEVLDYLGDRYSKGWDAVIAADSESTMEKLLRVFEYDLRFANENPAYLSTWHAFWGEANGSSLYRERSFPRDERYARDIGDLLAAFVAEGDYDPDELVAAQNGIYAMLFGLWTDAHLNPTGDNYGKGMAAIRLFLGKMFPRHPLPATG
jgi:AcrR family transcriptional regulator